MSYQDGIENILSNATAIRDSIEKRICSLPEGRVVVYTRKKNGRPYNTFILIREDGSRVYITKNKELIRTLTTKQFLSLNLILIDMYIERLKQAIRTAERISVQNIIEQMPEELREYLTFDEGEMSVRTRTAFLDRKIGIFMNEEYPVYEYSENSVGHVTSDGTIVKSKSELIIYEMLLEYHVNFRYERPITINGVEYHPDFTIILSDGRLIYWEHAGMMNIEKYRNKHKARMAAFESAGIVPWDNLIVTYDDKYGNINTRLIKSEIENKLLA